MLTLSPVPFMEAIEAAIRRKVELPNVYYGQLAGRARALSFSVAGIARVDHLRFILASLAKAQADGESFEEWRRGVLAKPGLAKLPRYRHENIFRTNLQSHYAAGRCVHIERHKDRRKYLLYSAILDERVRPAHAKMNGTIRPVDDPIWRTHQPPLGYQCRCSVVSLNERQARKRGGVTKLPAKADSRPDPGWDYSPCHPERGMREPVNARRPIPYAPANASDVVARAIAKASKVAEKPSYTERPDLPRDGELAAKELARTLAYLVT